VEGGKEMSKVSKNEAGQTLYIQLSVYRCGGADTNKNLTISCPDKDTQFRTTLSDYGLKKFKEYILNFYKEKVNP
jgi:hypothetical protein